MFSPENAILLVIDIQGKLAHLMHERNELFRHVSRLIQAAYILDVPIIITEQAPEKIGKTIPEITDVLKDYQPIPKTSFSCCGENQFIQKLESYHRKQIIVTGIESHVCVYQTVCDLLRMKYDAQVVGDAVSSRTLANKLFALDRIKAAEGSITSTEMIICELLKTSKHPKFKDIMGLLK